MLSNEQVKITATGDTNQAQAALNQLVSAMDRIAASGDKTQAKLDKAFDGGTASAFKFGQVLLGVQSTVAGVSKVVAQLNAEMENFHQRNAARGQAQTSVGDAYREFAGTIRARATRSPPTRAPPEWSPLTSKRAGPVELRSS